MIPDGEVLPVGDHAMMLTTDPPRHTEYRRLINRSFTPRAAVGLEERITGLARRVVDAVIERGECDLVTDIAGELPSFVIADLLGIPLDDGRKLYQLTETIHAAREAVPEGAQMGAVIEMFNYGAGVSADKRAHPDDDLSSVLLETLDDIDFNLYFMLLIDAGGDTTRNLVAGGMQALFENPSTRARLQADLSLLPGAVEEMLRWVSPVIYMRRSATRDCVIGDQAIAKGDKVVMYYGAANRDPAVFMDPDVFDIDRSPNPHIAFGGGGPHICLGAHIARLEIQAMFRELLTRMPDVEPAGDVEWLPSNFISGPKHMPVRFTPASP
jgi:cytochrome P450